MHESSENIVLLEPFAISLITIRKGGKGEETVAHYTAGMCCVLANQLYAIEFL